MRKADNLPPSCAVVTKSGNLNFLNPLGLSRPVTGLLYLYTTILILMHTKPKVSRKKIFFFWKGKYFNFRFFLLCKRDEAAMCQKYVYHLGSRRHVTVQNKVRFSQIASYQLLLRQEQSLGHVRSTILRQAARFVMPTSHILL